jgi:conflict system pore-forming effector with SLATT domain
MHVAHFEITDILFDEQHLSNSLTLLFKYAESVAMRKISWYREKKRSKQLVSQCLRFSAVVLAVAGGICPLTTGVFRDMPELVRLGYVLLAMAGGIVLLDRMFGFSSSWLRFMIAAQDIENELDQFRIEWLQRSIGASSAKENSVVDCLLLMRRFLEKVHGFVAHETRKWSDEFEQSQILLNRF